MADEKTVAFSEVEKLIKENNEAMLKSLERQQQEIKTLGEAKTATDLELTNIKAERVELNAKLTAEIDARKHAEAAAKRLPNGQVSPSDVVTVGEEFVKSAAYAEYLKKGCHGTSDGFELPGWAMRNAMDHIGQMPKSYAEGFSQKDAAGIGTDPTTFTVTPPYLYTPTFLPQIYGPLPRRVSVRELMPNIPTATGSIEFTRETGYLDNPFGSAAVVQESGASAQTGISFADEIAVVKLISHWVAVTRQILTDVPRLQAYINYKLMLNMRWKEDGELLYGAGGKDHLSGFKNTSNVQAYAWSDGIHTDTMADAIIKAMTKVSVVNMVATGIVMHPNDWTKIKTAKAATSGLYLYTDPATSGVDMLWGLPVAKTVAINEGEFLTGAFDMAAELHDRQQATIRISDNYTDYFIRNKMVLLAEERCELIVTRPEGFVWGTFDNQPAR